MSRFFRLAAWALSVCFLSLPVQAQDNNWKDRVDLNTRLTLQYIAEDNTDLGTVRDHNDSFSQQLQVLLGADLTDDVRAFFNGRALNISGDIGFQDESGADVSSDSDTAFLELRELYLTKKNLLNVVPLSLQVGRQRVREPRSLWWNSDTDLVRLNYDSSLIKGFIAAGENLASYRINTDDDFMEDDKNRFRVLSEASWQYTLNHFIEARAAYEDDHSGLEAIGTVIPSNDRDNEDQNLLWLGLRSTGKFEQPGASLNTLKYRADVIGVTGEEEDLTTAGGVVTGSNTRDVRAWAFDGGVTLDPLSKGGAVFTLDYAIGSGDDDPASGTDNEFRQTDVQGSSNRMSLERLQQRNYGEVLRPELSNIHILNAGARYPLSDAADIGLMYFYYRLDEDATSMRSSGINAPMNGTEKSIGQEMDFLVNIDIDDQFKSKLPLIGDVDFRFTAGTFMPGTAYNPNDDDNAYRIFSELKFGF